MKRFTTLLVVSLSLIVLSSCIRQADYTIGNSSSNNWVWYNNIQYEVMGLEDLPKALRDIPMQERMQERAFAYKTGDGFQYLLLTLGERRSGGYEIEIISVENTPGGIKITYGEIKPEKGQLVTLALTYPAIGLKIKSHLPVEVVRNKD